MFQFCVTSCSDPQWHIIVSRIHRQQFKGMEMDGKIGNSAWTLIAEGSRGKFEYTLLVTLSSRIVGN